MRQPSRRDTPKVRDRASYLYVQHARIEQDQRSVKFVTPDGTYPVPSAALTVLILGPGTSITQAAVRYRLRDRLVARRPSASVRDASTRIGRVTDFSGKRLS